MPAIFSIPVPGIHALPDFSPALTQHDIHGYPIAISAHLLIENMLTLSTYLITIDSQGNFFAPRDTSAYSPSLRVLHARLTDGYRGPSLLPPQFLTQEHVEQATQPNSITCDVRARLLSDFQDLYYALLARIREMQKRISDHLRSGFSTPHTPIHASGPTLADLHASLSAHWDFLNDPAAGRAMDEAIREARVQCIQDEIVAQVAGNMMSVEEAEAQIVQLRDPGVYEEQEGLEWTSEWDAALVNAKLGEKYRGVFEECRRRDRKGKAGARKRGKIGGELERRGGVQVEVVEQKGEDGFVGEERGVDRGEGEWLRQVGKMQHTTSHGNSNIDAQNQEPLIDRGEQEWLWQVEQMQHPAFREGFNIDAQDEPKAELLSQLRYVPDVDPIQEDELMEDIEFAPSVQQPIQQQMQQPDGPAPADPIHIDIEDIGSTDMRTAWQMQLQAQRQRVSQYTAYLRNRASTQASSKIGNPGQLGH